MNIVKYFFFLQVLFLSCGQEQPSPQEAAQVDPDIVNLSEAQIKNAGIQIGKVSMENMQHSISLNGVVDVPPQNTVSISFPISAFLKSTSLLPGMPVRKGDNIAVMEDAAL